MKIIHKKNLRVLQSAGLGDELVLLCTEARALAARLDAAVAASVHDAPGLHVSCHVLVSYNVSIYYYCYYTCWQLPAHVSIHY